MRAFENITQRNEFRKELEFLLREGDAERALSVARERLAQTESGQDDLARVAMEADPAQIALVGWNTLGERLAESDNGAGPITAISIDFSKPGHGGIDVGEEQPREPYLETSYLQDRQYLPFSQADRHAIVDCYGTAGARWAGEFTDIDSHIGTIGLAEFHWLVKSRTQLEAQDDADGDAYVLAACIAAIVLHLAVRHAIRTGGLPREMAVMVGSNEEFPFFDAPVVSAPEAASFVALPAPVEPVEDDLLMLEDEAAEEEPEPAISGTALRQRLITPESLIEEEPEKVGWLRGGLLRRFSAV